VREAERWLGWRDDDDVVVVDDDGDDGDDDDDVVFACDYCVFTTLHDDMMRSNEWLR